MTLGNKLKVTLVTICGMLLSQNALAELEYNLREGVTDLSREVYDLHMLVLWICVVIGVLVFGVMFYSMWAHSKKRNPEPAKFYHSTLVEIIWTTIPFIILIVLAVPATTTLIKLEDENNTDSDVRVLITGNQWYWTYEYLTGDAEGIKFNSSLSTPRDQIDGVINKETGEKVYAEKGENYLLEVDKPLVIPAGKKVRFLMTAKKVIHSWFVPDFSVKQDAVPGFINDAWTLVPEPGVYRGQCAELCGKDHGFMPIVVEVKSEADFAQWVSEQQAAVKKAEADAIAAAASSWSKDDLMKEGAAVYGQYCASCHGANGEGIATFPALDGSKIATGDINQHIDIVVNGKPPLMPAWKGNLTDAQLAAVITFERNAWSNKTGDVVQPADLANK